MKRIEIIFVFGDRLLVEFGLVVGVGFGLGDFEDGVGAGAFGGV